MSAALALHELHELYESAFGRGILHAVFSDISKNDESEKEVKGNAVQK